MKNFRAMIPPSNGQVVPPDDPDKFSKLKPIFTPYTSFYRQGYVEANYGQGYSSLEWQLEPLVYASQVRNYFLPGLNRTRVGITYLTPTKPSRNAQSLEKNYNYLNNAEYGRLISNLFDCVSLYFVEEVQYSSLSFNDRIDIEPILNELITNPQFNLIYKVESEKGINVTNHNLNTYYGTTGGGSFDVKQDFIIGRDLNEIVTLSSIQEMRQYTSDLCYWTVRKFDHYHPFKQVSQYYYTDMKISTSELYPNQKLPYISKIMEYPVYDVRAEHYRGNQTLGLMCVILAVPKNSRSKITERNIFTAP